VRAANKKREKVDERMGTRHKSRSFRHVGQRGYGLHLNVKLTVKLAQFWTSFEISKMKNENWNDTMAVRMVGDVCSLSRKMIRHPGKYMH